MGETTRDLAHIAKVEYLRTDPRRGNRKRFACNLTVVPDHLSTSEDVVAVEERAHAILRLGGYHTAEPDLYVSKDEESEPPTTRASIFLYAKDELDAARLAAGFVALLEQGGISWIPVTES